MQRYFIESDSKLSIGENYNILKNDVNNTDYHHIKNVMRMKTYDKVYLSTNSDDCYIAEIIDINEEEVVLNVIEIINRKVELPSEVVIAQGLVRREKTEEVLRRITELGASGFVQVAMERSIVKVKDYSKNDKIDRMKKIVKEASEQSHRNKIPVVYDLLSFKNFINNFKDYDIKLYAYEESGRANEKSFKTVIKNAHNKKMIILVGPEGGISDNEVKILNNNGFQSIGLGPRILRTETAPLYIMSAISYELEL